MYLNDTAFAVLRSTERGNDNAAGPQKKNEKVLKKKKIRGCAVAQHKKKKTTRDRFSRRI